MSVDTALDPIVLGDALEALARHHGDIDYDDLHAIVDVVLAPIRSGARAAAWELIATTWTAWQDLKSGMTDPDRYGPWTCGWSERRAAASALARKQFDDAIAAAVALYQEEVTHG